MTEASEESVTITPPLETPPQEPKRTTAQINQDYVNAMAQAGESYCRAVSIRKNAEDLVGQEQKKLDELVERFGALNKEMQAYKPTPEELLTQKKVQEEITKQSHKAMAQ